MASGEPTRGILRLGRRPLTARHAAQAIGLVTLGITLASGVAMWLIDNDDFGSVGLGLWWAVQTVTTVGYGDHVPTTVTGRLLATLVMISGIGFVTVVTATITAAFVESTRKQLRADQDAALDARLDDLAARLERIEATLTKKG